MNTKLFVLFLAASIWSIASSTYLRKTRDLESLGDAVKGPAKSGTLESCSISVSIQFNNQAGCAQVYKTITNTRVCSTRCDTGLQYDTQTDTCIPCSTTLRATGADLNTTRYSEYEPMPGAYRNTAKADDTSETYSETIYFTYDDQAGCEQDFETSTTIRITEISCNPGLQWDFANSVIETCIPCATTAPPTEATTTLTTMTPPITMPSTTENPCEFSCTSKPNGDYADYYDCSVYTTCSNGVMYGKRPCAPGMFWIDTLKRCEPPAVAQCVVLCTCPPTAPTEFPPVTEVTTSIVTITPTTEPATTSQPYNCDEPFSCAVVIGFQILPDPWDCTKCTWCYSDIQIGYADCPGGGDRDGTTDQNIKLEERCVNTCSNPRPTTAPTVEPSTSVPPTTTQGPTSTTEVTTIPSTPITTVPTTMTPIPMTTQPTELSTTILPTTTTGPTSTTPSTEVTTTPQPYNCDEPFSCQAGPFGVFSDPFNCDLCYACAFGGILHHASCSEWGKHTKQNSSVNVDERCTNICPNPITTVAPTTLPTTTNEPTSTAAPTTVPSTTPTPEDPCNFSCVGKANGNYPNPNFCFGYFVCAGEVKFPFWCDVKGEDIGQQFNPVTKKCEDRLIAGCVVQCTPGTFLSLRI